MLLEAIAVLPEQHVLKGMFRKVQLRPSEQTFHTFQIPSRVYLRFSSLKTTSKLAYVGSTTQTVAAREATRFRKFQQLKNERMVSVELSQDNFWDWAALPITPPIPNEFLLGREHATIQDLQPALNFPFIQQWFCPRRGIFTSRNAGKPHTLGFGRVFRKLRKAQTRPGRFLFPPRTQAIFELPGFRDREEMWQLLCDLGSNTSVRFEAEKRHRTNAYNLAALCSLRKKSMCLPVHLQMSACKAIDSALRFKGFEPPRLSAPLTIPFLSGPKLRSVMRQVLRLFLSQNPGFFLPFYMPKTTLVFAKNPKVFELLHTHKRALRTWASGDKPSCLCREMQHLFKITLDVQYLDRRLRVCFPAQLPKCCPAAQTVQFFLAKRRLLRFLRKGFEDGFSDITSARMSPGSFECSIIFGSTMNSSS